MNTQAEVSVARLDKARRRAVAKVLPPVKCSGTIWSTGLQCDQWAVVGATVCPTHGGRAPQVREAAERRVSIAEALVRNDPRPPWEVLEDALRVADVVMQDALGEVKELGSVTPQLLDKLIAAVERAHRLAKVNLDAGIDQRRMRLAEAQAEQMQRVFTRVLNGLGLTAEQQALVPQLLRREIQGVVTREIEAA